jgi:hypothetical protein
MEHYGLTGGFVEVCKIVYCLKAAIQEHPVVVDCDYSPVQSRCRKADIEIVNH